MENRQRKKSWLDAFIVWLLAALQKSFLGRFFTSYNTANDKFVKKIKVKNRKSEKRFAKFIEKNRFFGVVPRIIEYLLRIPLRDYGIILFMTGAVVTALYPLNGMILFIDPISFERFVAGASVCICSIPLLFSRKNIAANILSSRLFSFLLFEFFGIDDEGMNLAEEKGRVTFAAFAFLIGAGFGVASYFISPLGTVLAVVALVLAYCTVRTPEIGAIVTVFLVPFGNKYIICSCIAYTFLCYAIKVKLGKRVFKFEYFDLWITILILALTVCGFNYAKPWLAWERVLINLVILMSYFLYANLIYSKVWFRRSIVAFSASSLIVAAVAVVQAILSYISGKVEAFSNVFPADGEIVSTLGSSTVLAYFMVIAIPFALVHMISEKKGITRFMGFVLAAFMIAALVLTNSAMGLFGLLVGALLIFAFYKRMAIYLIAVVVIALPLLYFFLPESAISAITSQGPLKGVSVMDELVYFKDSFITVIKKPMGANLSGATMSGLYGAEEFDSLPIQMLAEYGVVGFVAFMAVLVMFTRVILSYSVKAKNAYRRINGCAGLCSMLALLTVGIFNNVWEDERVFLAFVIIMALSLAYVKIDRDEEAVVVTYVDIASASIDVPLKETYVAKTRSRRFVQTSKIQKQIKKQQKNKNVEAKEFSNTEGLIIGRKEYEENETEEPND